MHLVGLSYLESLLEREHFQAKTVFNDRGAIFFPVNEEHRNMKSEGISYRDNYEGNALAAMVGPGKLDIRYHRDFSDKRVAGIIQRLVCQPRLEFMKPWRFFYQARQLSLTILPE